MHVVTDIDQCDSGPHAHVVAIGVFDGVHLGHRKLIELLKQTAADLSTEVSTSSTAVVTFDPHPAYVVRSGNAPKLLTELDHKLELLDAAGVDTAIVVRFDDVRARQTPEEFVKTFLVDCLSAEHVVVGRDFHFGAKRAGNVEVLARLGLRYGFDVHGVQLLPRVDGPIEPVSSTVIRRALAGGDVAKAAVLLDRPHEVRGPVIDGNKRGRKIGFPTANIAVAATSAIPADAVYACWYIRPGGQRWAAAVNIGKRPTFYQNAERSVVEAHLIGFDGSLYGETARLQFVELLRSEQRFDGVEALTAQLQRDVDQAERVLLGG